MTIEVKPFQNIPHLFNELESLALDQRDVVFRGHQDASWVIGSTLARHTSIPHAPWSNDIDEMLSHFLANAVSLASVPFSLTDRRSRLEYGRHHGVPTPVIDFTHSPYVAAYFAFSGLQWRHGSDPKDAAIYALNLPQLAECWARYRPRDDWMKDFHAFMHEDPSFFERGYPSPKLKLIPFCASWNKRMMSQQGCFIYDTLDYKNMGFSRNDGFEELVGSMAEPEPPQGEDKQPILTKFLVPQSQASSVFARLELMNVTGTKLLDHEGLAIDVKNAYNYNRKSGYAWDLHVPAPE